MNQTHLGNLMTMSDDSIIELCLLFIIALMNKVVKD